MGLIDEEGNFPKSRQAFMIDALATMFGSIFGCSPITSYIESGAGVEAGSKTGLTAVIIGFYFFISIFFAPIIASIPPWATGGSLVIVGALMAKSLGNLKWHKLSHAVSGFLTVIVMPLTYSIAYGLIAGIGSYVVMEGFFHLLSYAGVKKPDTPPEEEADDSGKIEKDVAEAIDVEEAPAKDDEPKEAPKEVAPAESSDAKETPAEEAKL